MLNVLSILESYSKNGLSIDEVLFSEDPSLADILASKSTLEALFFGATLDPTMRPDLRCMYDSMVQGELETTA